MQRRDDIAVIDGMQGTLEELMQIERHPKETHRVIGNSPNIGDKTTIHGLEYVVKKVMPRGRVMLKLVGLPDKDGPEAT